MQLPFPLSVYALALLQATKSLSTVHLSNFVLRSHDFLTRAIKLKVSWKPIFAGFLDRALHWYLIIDETEIDKSFSKFIPGLSWIYSHLQGKYIFGYHIVVLVAYNGSLTIPLTWKFYQKDSGKTKIELAIELIKYGLWLIPSPIAILFDSFYAAEKILKLLKSKNITFYSQVPKSRLFNGTQLKKHNSNRPYWEGVGHLRGNIQVKVVKFRRKYFISNRIDQSGRLIRKEYSKRWRIEEVFRFCKTALKMQTCQMRELKSQHNNVGICLYLYSILQDIAAKKQMTVYRIKDLVSLNRSIDNIPYLKAYFNAA